MTINKLKGKTFLAVDKAYQNLGLKSLDLLLIAQIEEFQRNGCMCYMTNAQFSLAFGESESTVKRRLDKLEALNIISRTTIFISGKGKANRQRSLKVNERSAWNIQIEDNISVEGSVIEMEGANEDDARFKNIERKDHIEPIKDTVKYKVIDNRKDNTESISSNEGDLSVLFENIGISYGKNTKQALEEIVKESLDYDVMKEIIDSHQSLWRKYKNKPSGYKFRVVEALVKKEYQKTKYQINARKSQSVNTVELEHYERPKRDLTLSSKPKRKTVEEIENEVANDVVIETRQQKTISYDGIKRTQVVDEPKKEKEGMSSEDLLELMNEPWYDDDLIDNVSDEDKPVESLLLLEQLRLMKSESDCLDEFSVSM